VGLVARRELTSEALIARNCGGTYNLKRNQKSRIFRASQQKNPPGLLRTLIVPLTTQAQLTTYKVSGLPAEQLRYETPRRRDV
jgi:hypothetical protein